jgi:hypothetical protein
MMAVIEAELLLGALQYLRKTIKVGVKTPEAMIYQSVDSADFMLATTLAQMLEIELEPFDVTILRLSSPLLHQLGGIAIVDKEYRPPNTAPGS